MLTPHFKLANMKIHEKLHLRRHVTFAHGRAIFRISLTLISVLNLQKNVLLYDQV